jgi:hypothetical protein
VQGTLPLAGAARGNSLPWIALARPAARAQFLLVAIAFGCLTWAFVANDFSVVYVAQHSNSRLPLEYRIAGVWGGHEGSLLLWMLMLSAGPWRCPSSRATCPTPWRRACSACWAWSPPASCSSSCSPPAPSSACCRRPTTAAT